MEGFIPARRRVPAALAVVTAGLGLMAFSPAAFAGTVSRSGTGVSYDAGAENNAVIVSQGTSGALKTVTVSDPGGVTPGAGCTEISNLAARCDLSALSAINVDLGGGDDSVQAPSVTAPMNLYGDGGDDTLSGGSAGDTIEGGAGDDTLHGNAGNDTIYGRGGADKLFGDAGNDYLDAGDGADHLWGGADQDHLIGYLGDDVLRGDAGDDLLEAGAGADFLNGDAGVDTYRGDAGSDTIYSVDDASEQVDCGGGLLDFGVDTATVNDGDLILDDSCENYTFLPKTS